MNFLEFFDKIKDLYNDNSWQIQGSVGTFINYVNQTPPPHGDEMNLRTAIVFPFFKLLNWPAGTNQSIWDHDASISSTNQTRPDSIIRNPLTLQSIFVLDTKPSNSTLEDHLNQIKNYAIQVGVRFGILANGKRLVVFDFTDGENIIFDLEISEWVENNTLDNSKLELNEFYDMFLKDNFEKLEILRQEVSLSEKQWLTQALPVEDHIEDFIKNVVNFLDHLIKSLLNQFLIILKNSDEYYKKAEVISEKDNDKFIPKNEIKFERIVNKLINSNLNQTTKNEALLELKKFINEPFKYSSVKTAMKQFSSDFRTKLLIKESFLEYMNFIIDHEVSLRKLKNLYAPSLKLRKNFNIWKETIGILFKSDLKKEFVTQSAYLLFVRVIFIRICEDNRIFERRLSDGGLTSWHTFVDTFYTSPLSSQSQSSTYEYFKLLSIVFNRTRLHYAHFFQDEDIYRWFSLTDVLFLELISILSKYNFSGLNFDIIGRIYESYVDRFDKKQKGLFYTPPEIIKYILDEIGYINSQVILDKTLVDFSCGSGSFLVHAAKRLIDAHKNASGQIPYPDKLVERISENLIGLDINPFSCYLAEINIFIELIKVWGANMPQIGKFSIYQTNSLDTEYASRQRNLGQFISSAYYDEMMIVEKIKTLKGRYSCGFDYYVGNPPYGAKTNPKALKDQDTFISFLKMGVGLLSNNGKIGYLLPGVWLSNTGSSGAADKMSPIREFLLKKLNLISVTNLFDVTFQHPFVDNIVLIGQKSNDLNQIKQNIVQIRHVDKLTGKLSDVVNGNWGLTIATNQNIWNTNNYSIDLVPDPIKIQMWQRIKPQNVRDSRYIALDDGPFSLANVEMGISPYQGWTVLTHGYTAKQAKIRGENYSDRRIGANSYLAGESKHAHRWCYFFNSGNYKWIEDYNRLGGKPSNPNIFIGPRVIFKRLINRPRRTQVCLVENQDFVISKNSYVLKARDNNITTLKYIFAVLNSKILSFIMIYVPYFDMRRVKDDHPTLEPGDFKHLPIPNPTSQEKTQIVNQIDIVNNQYQRLMVFLENYGRITIYTKSSNQTKTITFSKPGSFTFLTYIRDINRVDAFPPIRDQTWGLFLSDWETSGDITVIGNLNDKIRMNKLLLQKNPPKLQLRNNIFIESINPDLLKFVSLMINHYNPEKLSDIMTSRNVPALVDVSNYVNIVYPQKKNNIITSIQSAWNEDDNLEQIVQDLYSTSPLEAQFINQMTARWIRQ